MRIATIEQTVENEKYTFRRFLLKLGFGDDYKTVRKVHLTRLDGDSAWMKSNCTSV